MSNRRRVIFGELRGEVRVGFVAGLDISGRKVVDLHAGASDLRALAPGVYFVRGEGRGAGDMRPIRKVVVTK